MHGDGGSARRPWQADRAGDGGESHHSRSHAETHVFDPLPGENALIPVCGAQTFSTAGPLWTRSTGGGFAMGRRP